MEDTCHGFVLKTIPYGDSGLAVKVLTDTLGATSFMVQGAKRRGKSSKAGLFSPMNHVHITFIRKENRDLYTARQTTLFHMYPSLLTDVRKPAVAMYMAEALYRAVTEHQHEDELYRFAADQMEQLDQNERLTHFPQQFLVGLIQIYGLIPHGKIQCPNAGFFAERKHVYARLFGRTWRFLCGTGRPNTLSDLFTGTEPETALFRRYPPRNLASPEDYLNDNFNGRFTLLWARCRKPCSMNKPEAKSQSGA